MHAVLVELELKVDPAQADEAIKFLRETVVPMISQGAGFVSGTWMRSADGTRTRRVGWRAKRTQQGLRVIEDGGALQQSI